MNIDARMLDTDNRFFDYCQRMDVKDPFEESREMIARRSSEEFRDGHRVTIVREETAEEKERRLRNIENIKEYLRLSNTFRLWDFHFWMTRAQFEQHLHWAEGYTDTSIYMPCDTVERQCSMACMYFLRECPREEGELKTPQILGFDGRWEFNSEGP